MTTRPSCIPADRSWPPRRVQAPAETSGQAGALHVVGRVVHRAELRHGADGKHSVLAFDVDAGKGLPFLVRQVISADPAALRAAELKAQHLHVGAIVRIHAHGCTARMDHDTAALLLLDVIDITTSEGATAC